MKTILALTLATILTGCASTEQYSHILDATEEADLSHLITKKGNGKIYIFRDKSILGSAVAFEITDNGRPIGRIGYGGMLAWERPAGLAVISSRKTEARNALNFNVNSNKVYFIRLQPIADWGFGAPNTKMWMLYPEKGIKELKKREKD